MRSALPAFDESRKLEGTPQSLHVGFIPKDEEGVRSLEENTHANQGPHLGLRISLVNADGVYEDRGRVGRGHDTQQSTKESTDHRPSTKGVGIVSCSRLGEGGPLKSRQEPYDEQTRHRQSS